MINRSEYEDLVKNIEGYLQGAYDQIETLQKDVASLTEKVEELSKPDPKPRAKAPAKGAA